ncbi:MAG TPA: hypothetical protein VG713_03670 [Pirellulales bacterium]|nr:hypothetical protein [Pirellulales bacterium]
MFSPFPSGDAAPRPEPSSHEPAEPNPEALERILDQTLRSAQDPAGPDDPTMFDEVARAHAGEPFTVEPIAVDLVRAALRSQMNAGWSPALEGASKCIAVSLCDDPTSRQRLERLWSTLSKR